MKKKFSMVTDEEANESLNSKHLLQATITDEIIDAMKQIWLIEKKKKEEACEPPPNWSQTTEKLLRLGVKTYNNIEKQGTSQVTLR